MPPRVLLLHNRYRVVGGEERSVELHRRALERAGIEHALLERRSADVGQTRAASAMLRGGSDEDEIGPAVRALGAGIVHAHNVLPLIGPRGLEAARAAGARVVLHVHNVRLFCAIGVGARDGRPCMRCRGRRTLPGLVLNCRRSVPQAAVYAAALSAHQPAMLAAVDRFVAPSEFAAGHLARLGLPRERVQALRHYLPEEAFASASHAGRGSYALVASRLSPEKGIDAAIRAAAAAGVALRIAGEGSADADLRRQAARSGADVQFVGKAGRGQMTELLAGAAAVLMPSRCHEFSPYTALEAMAQGVPVVATAMGGLPELLGADRCVPALDEDALAARLAALWADPELREAEGQALLQRARERHSEERHVGDLMALYASLPGRPASPNA